MSDLHNDLIKLYNKYSIESDGIKINNAYRYVFDVIAKNKLIISGSHIVMGSYDRVKNVFIWGNKSATLDKSMVIEIEDARSKLNSDKSIKLKLIEDTVILSTQDLFEELYIVSQTLNKEILVDFPTIYIVKNIFSDNRQ